MRVQKVGEAIQQLENLRDMTMHRLCICCMLVYLKKKNRDSQISNLEIHGFFCLG